MYLKELREAVSYTHLDVYKRQRTDSEEWHVGTVYEPKKKRTTVSLEQPVGSEAVSYTHLDVYKRQL